MQTKNILITEQQNDSLDFVISSITGTCSNSVFRSKQTFSTCKAIKVKLKVETGDMTIKSYLRLGSYLSSSKRIARRVKTCVFPDRTSSFPPSNGCHFASQRNQSTVTTNATTETAKCSTWIRRICLIKSTWCSDKKIENSFSISIFLLRVLAI